MDDGLIRCADGCGAMLSWARLRDGARGPNGISCERCVAERMFSGFANRLELPPEQAVDLVRRGVAWVMKDDTAP